MKQFMFITYCFLLLIQPAEVTAAESECLTSADALQQVIEVEGRVGQVEDKITTLEKLVRIYRECQLPEDSVYARILHRLGDLHRVNGDFSSGIQLTQQAVSINRRRVNDASPSFLTNSYYNLGIYYALLSDFPRSNNYFDSCIYAGKQFGHKMQIVLMAYEQKCFNYFNAGDYQMAVAEADHGLWTSEKNNWPDFIGIFLQHKAQAQHMLGDNDKAFNHARQAIDVLRDSKLPAPYLASALGTFARIMTGRKDQAATVRYYKDAIKLNYSVGNFLQCSRDLHDLGYVYDAVFGDSANAIACFKEGIALLTQVPDPYLRASHYNNLGLVYWRGGNYEAALRYYQMALMALPIGFHDESVLAIPSRQMLKAISKDHFVGTLLENKGESLLFQFKKTNERVYLEHALKTFLAADKLIDQMRQKQVYETSKLFWRERTKKMYEHALETCYLLNDIDHAFYFLEKSRSALLNDKLNELGARKSLSPLHQARDRELRGEFQILQSRLELDDLSEHEKQTVLGRWYQVQQELNDHSAMLKRRYPLYFQYRMDTTTVSIPQLQAQLQKHRQTFISYLTADSNVYTIVVGPDQISFQKVELPELGQNIERYLTYCSTPAMLNRDYNKFLTLSNTLYTKLFASLPVDTKRVVISFDDYFIPFESLISDVNNPTSFLLRKHIISYIYSGSFLNKGENQDELEDTMLGVAPVWYDAGLNLAPLKGAEMSLSKIRENFGAGFSLVKETATKESFIDVFPRYGIVHVYSHAIAADSSGEPELYFHDQAVRLRDLQMLPEVKTRLLVLSGCETGVGRTIKGEGVLSLARGFAAAGIPSTITTLWSVDDQVTYRIMEYFYHHIARGVSSDEALHLAKLDFLDNHDGENELPYYWASTVALGNTVKVNKYGFFTSGSGVLILSLAAFISISVFFLRKKILVL